MIPLDLSSTNRLSSDEKSLPSPLRPPTDINICVPCTSPQTIQSVHSVSPSSSSSSSSSSSCLHRTLRPRHPARRLGPLASSWSSRRRRRPNALLRHSVDTAAANPTVPTHRTPDLPQLVECDDDSASAADRTSETVMECRADITSQSSSRVHAPASAAQQHQIPADPRRWSRDDVASWLRETALQFNMASIDVSGFPFNGKAMVLMTRSEMFESRVPRGGKLLFREFQARLLRAVHAAATVT